MLLRSALLVFDWRLFSLCDLERAIESGVFPRLALWLSQVGGRLSDLLSVERTRMPRNVGSASRSTIKGLQVLPCGHIAIHVVSIVLGDDLGLLLAAVVPQLCHIAADCIDRIFLTLQCRTVPLHLIHKLPVSIRRKWSFLLAGDLLTVVQRPLKVHGSAWLPLLHLRLEHHRLHRVFALLLEIVRLDLLRDLRD